MQLNFNHKTSPHRLQVDARPFGLRVLLSWMVLCLLTVCIGLTFAQPARAADTGYLTPGADDGNPSGWTNFSYTTLASATGSQTYSPANTTPGFVSTFTFGIPAGGAQIDGIEVHVYGFSSKNNNTSTFGVELSGDNGSTWTTTGYTGTFHDSSPYENVYLGAYNDNWGWATKGWDGDNWPKRTKVRTTSSQNLVYGVT
jgi:hypothetical protein